MKRRRVLMICSQVPPVYGGAGQQALAVGGELVKRGWDVSFRTLDQGCVGSGREGSVIVRRILRGETRVGWRRSWASLVLGVVGACDVARDRPSVVHVHGSYWWSIPPAIMARILGAKLIVKITRDGDDDPITTKRKRIGGLRAGIVYSLPHRLAHKIVGLNPSAIASAELAGWGEKTVLIRNGVDSQLHAEALSHRCHLRREHHVSQSTRILIFVGFLARHKGVLDLLDAWDSLSDSDSLLWLVGPYSGFYRELDSETGSAVLAAAARDERIKLFGAVPMNQIPSLLAAADVFVLPSYVEGMPNSLLEAMVSGCKVVGTDIPGIRELCTGGDILIVPPGDSSALAEALRGAMKEAGKGPRVLGRPDLLLASTVDQLEGLYLADSR